MLHKYLMKVPRKFFEDAVKKYKNSFFSPDGPYLISNTEIGFTYRFGKKRITIIASLGNDDFAKSSEPYQEKQITATFNKMVTYHKYDNENLPSGFNIKQIMWYNPKYNDQKVDYAVAYDMNSAFGFAELGLIPDTSREYTGMIKKGDVGLQFICGNWTFGTSGHGYKCFPLIEWDAHKFVNLYYERKEKAQLPELRQKYKDYLNHHVGSMKWHNNIIRCWIIHQSNKNIERYKDENTLLMNTDSIISLKPRPDIPRGHNIGQFKIEAEGSFALYKNNYQFYDADILKMRGLHHKHRFGFDILSRETRKTIEESGEAGYNFIKGKFTKGVLG